MQALKPEPCVVQDDDSKWLNNQFSIWSVCICSVCLLILWATLALGLHRVHAACKSRKHW
jgi:hypothetical protein